MRADDALRLALGMRAQFQTGNSAGRICRGQMACRRLSCHGSDFIRPSVKMIYRRACVMCRFLNSYEQPRIPPFLAEEPSDFWLWSHSWLPCCILGERLRAMSSVLLQVKLPCKQARLRSWSREPAQTASTFLAELRFVTAQSKLLTPTHIGLLRQSGCHTRTAWLPGAAVCKPLVRFPPNICSTSFGLGVRSRFACNSDGSILEDSLFFAGSCYFRHLSLLHCLEMRADDKDIGKIQ